jgi:hypothetical protein
VVNDFSGFGKVLMGLGGVLVISGALMWLGGKIPGIGRLPGDIFVKKENFCFYFPLTTCIIVSIVLSLILALFRRR